MSNSTSYTHGTIQYDDLLRDLRKHREMLKINTAGVRQGLETTRTLTMKKVEEFVTVEREMNEKKIALQQSIAKMRHTITQTQQDLEAKRLALTPKESENKERIQERAKQLESLLGRKNQLQNRIRQVKHEQEEAIKSETENALLTELELQTFRHALQLEIVNTNAALRFEFKCINKQAPEKIYHILLTITDTDAYKVIECQPDSVLPKISKELDVLNQDRELFNFIKKVRQIFRQSANA